MKAKTRQELSEIYGINRKTFNRWLTKKNIILPKGLVCPKDQEMIFSTFGEPKVEGKSKRQLTVSDI